MNKKTFDLISPFAPSGDQVSAIAVLEEGYREGKSIQNLLGVTGSGKTFTMANIIQKLGKKTLILAHNKTLAAQLYAEFREFFPHNSVEYFVSYYDYYRPEAYVAGRDIYIEKDAAINDEIDKLRHSATKNLLERDDVIVIASVSCIYGIGSPSEYANQKITIFDDSEYDRDDFIKDLISIQFTRNDIELSRGSFRVRGESVYVFPSHEESKVVRIEFYDNLVEKITLVDPLRGTTLKKLNKVIIYPKSHYVVSDVKMEKALETIKVELRERINCFEVEEKLVEKQRLEQRTLYDLEMLEEMGFCSGIENYSRHFTGLKAGVAPPTLIDYFGNDFLFIIDESHITLPQVGGMFRGDQVRKQSLVDHGFRLPSALDNRPLNFKEFQSKFKDVLLVSATPGDFELSLTNGEYTEQIIRPTGLLDPEVIIRDAKTQIDDLCIEVKKTIKNGYRILVTTLTKKLAEEIANYYTGLGLKIKYLHSDIDTIERVEIINGLRSGEFDILVGINLLREGLDIPEVALVAILDADREGFLRSYRSLIQTIGRAARNAKGRVILYSYKTTKSMKKAIEETDRRRQIQIKYNLNNNIQPKTIIKKINTGVIETLRGVKRKSLVKRRKKLVNLNIESIDQQITILKKEMKIASKELRFEDAAIIRDEIKELVEARLLI